MKEQVLSIEQMQELIKLGINVSKASMCWNTYDSFLIANDSDLKDAFNYSDDDWVPTFTLQDIMTLLDQYHRLMVIKHEPNEWINSAFTLLKFQCKNRNN